jgi:hypothetical protein
VIKNELAKALVDERLRDAERERLARTVCMRSRGTRTCVSGCPSRFASWNKAMRSPGSARGAGDGVRVRADVAPAARLRAATAAGGITDSADS